MQGSMLAGLVLTYAAAACAWQPSLFRVSLQPQRPAVALHPTTRFLTPRRPHAGLQCRAGGVHEEGKGTRSEETAYQGPGFRVVKCFPHLARRQADQAVQDGRVTVNGELATPSLRLRGGDVLTLDGKPVKWESRAVAEEQSAGDKFVYFKYHKPIDVASSWDKNDRSSILHFLPPDMLVRRGGGEGQAMLGKFPTKDMMEMRRQQQMGTYKGKRLFPVGRLDKDSTGLMLLTDDGRVVNALLQPRASKDKEYIVKVNRKVPSSDVETLASGVEITTTQQRGNMQVVTGMTLPCIVENLSASKRAPMSDFDEDDEAEDIKDTWERRGARSRGQRGGRGGRGGRGRGGGASREGRSSGVEGDTLRFVIQEGRNRQIRRMLDALGYRVISLTRVRFGDIQLGCPPLSFGRRSLLAACPPPACPGVELLPPPASPLRHPWSFYTPPLPFGSSLMCFTLSSLLVAHCNVSPDAPHPSVFR
jgi:pseudouridine synthase